MASRAPQLAISSPILERLPGKPPGNGKRRPATYVTVKGVPTLMSLDSCTIASFFIRMQPCEM